MDRHIIKIILLATIFISSDLFAVSCVQNNNEVGLTGLDGPAGSIYVGISQSNKECSCNYFRFYSTNTDTNKALSILMSAKMSGKKVRIDILDSSNCNTGYRVYLY